MRLFVSADLDGPEDAVAAVQEPLAGLPGLNLTDPAQAHVTVKFLGDGPDDGHDLDALDDALAAAVEDTGVDPFEADFEGLGVFPSLEYIRVVWLGVDAGGEELTRLHEAVEERTTALGYEPESHEFTPHVTLARMNHAAAKERVQEYVREGTVEVGRRRIEELRLTESKLTDSGPVYETVERYPLG